MLTISQVTKAFGGRTLFEEASLQVNRGDRIGLVGPNGAGKSTLFSLILGDALPDEGRIFAREIGDGWISSPGTCTGKDETVLELACGEGRMIPARRDGLGDRAEGEAHPCGTRFSRIGFRTFDKTLSGGWVMRAHLARLLVQEPELLLLDEPTNHLDLESLVWFQEYLKNYPGAILMISHDREIPEPARRLDRRDRASAIESLSGELGQLRRTEGGPRRTAARAYKNQQKEIGIPPAFRRPLSRQGQQSVRKRKAN